MLSMKWILIVKANESFFYVILTSQRKEIFSKLKMMIDNWLYFVISLISRTSLYGPNLPCWSLALSEKLHQTIMWDNFRQINLEGGGLGMFKSKQVWGRP